MKSKLLITLLITCSLCTNTNVYAKGFHGGHSSHSHSHIGGRSSHSTHISKPKISKPPSGTKAKFKSSTSKSIRNSTNKPSISKPSTKVDNKDKSSTNDTTNTPKSNNTNTENKTNNKSSNVVNKPPVINNMNNNINSQPSKKHSFFNSGWFWFLLGRSTSHRQPVHHTQHLQNGEANQNNSIQQDTEKQDNHRKILRNLVAGGVISVVAIVILRKLFK